MRGIISALNSTKGFGFIRDEEGRDRFFNRSNTRGSDIPFDQIEDGMEVEFEPYTLPQSSEDRQRDPTKPHNNLRARKIRVVNS